MYRIIVVVNIIIIFFLGFMVYKGFTNSPIKDDYLRAAIMIELDLEDQMDDKTRPNKEDLKQLESINYTGVFDYKVKNLKGLQHAINLKELIVIGNEVKNVKPLKDLTKLEKINLSHVEGDGSNPYLEPERKIKKFPI